MTSFAGEDCQQSAAEFASNPLNPEPGHEVRYFTSGRKLAEIHSTVFFRWGARERRTLKCIGWWSVQDHGLFWLSGNGDSGFWRMDRHWRALDSDGDALCLRNFPLQFSGVGRRLPER
jgi:hypothetical protein